MAGAAAAGEPPGGDREMMSITQVEEFLNNTLCQYLTHGDLLWCGSMAGVWSAWVVASYITEGAGVLHGRYRYSLGRVVDGMVARRAVEKALAVMLEDAQW